MARKAARELRSYQKRALVKFSKKNEAFFAMEMRLGKTLTCIRWFKKKRAKKVLIVAPKTVLTSWEEELKLEGVECLNLADGTLVDRVIDLFECSPEATLINYDSVAKLGRAIKAARFDCIVCDESVKIKNPKASVTKSLVDLGKSVEYRAALSGLPTPNSWFDLFTQMQFLHGGTWLGFKNFYQWRNSYAVKNEYSYFISKNKRLKIKEAFHKSAFTLSREEAGFNNEPVIQDRRGELPAKVKSLYDHVFKHWEYPDESKQTQTILTAIQWLQRISGGNLPGAGRVSTWKLQELRNIVEDELPNSSSIVIWVAFNDEIEPIKEILKDECLVLTGQTKNSKQVQADFQAGKKRIIIVQQAKGKYGIRLDRADTAIYYSTTYDYDAYAQSKDRIVDFDKPYPLLIINLITSGTVEDKIHSLLKDKKSDAKTLLVQAVQSEREALGFFGPRNPGGRDLPLERSKPASEPRNSRERKRLVVKKPLHSRRNNGCDGQHPLFS